MAVGFVLINAAPAKERELKEKLESIDEVIEVYPLFGEWDLIVKIETETLKLLGQTIVDKIRSIAGVIDTKTLTGAEL